MNLRSASRDAYAAVGETPRNQKKNDKNAGMGREEYDARTNPLGIH
jgi:hypothetical protein